MGRLCWVLTVCYAKRCSGSNRGGVQFIVIVGRVAQAARHRSATATSGAACWLAPHSTRRCRRSCTRAPTAREGDPRHSIFAKIRRLRIHRGTGHRCRESGGGRRDHRRPGDPAAAAPSGRDHGGRARLAPEELTEGDAEADAEVGDRPILELLIESFVDQGFSTISRSTTRPR